MSAAAKAAALEVVLAAKSSRIASLEARVSFLEAENARLRRAMADRSTGKGGPNLRRSEEMAGGRVARDVIEVSDGEEEGMAVDVRKGRGAEEGMDAVATPRKRAALRVVIGESGDEYEIDDAKGDGDGDGGDHGSVSCGDNVGLEDDDVTTALPDRKRAAALVVTSDSEDEVESQGGHGRRGHGTVATEIESSDDDMIPIREVVKKMRKERASKGGGGFGETNGSSTPATRRSARLAKGQPKRAQSARRVLNFVEPKDCEESASDSDEDDDLDDFIINDSDCSENSANSAEPEESDASAPSEGSSSELEESDNEIDYKDVMACIGRKRNAKEWKYEAEMLSAFAAHPELCLKAVCALYRKQTKDEQEVKATILHNKQGFNQIDAARGSSIAEFLLDGDTFGPLKKTVHDLEQYDRYALEFCHKLAARYSKQLFSIYQNKEDPYFHP
ncbi:hypothetical protein OsI_00936 [Oryza sativa Indica Group]|uniref:Uncharacterized protein n=1 Tax=Oryza sativa subsp. indica TaxID=39946 RepID=B8AAL9_ORYSI|nr:hypothetical protein OsI_00936 [Oryza sativa Indica Group]